MFLLLNVKVDPIIWWLKKRKFQVTITPFAIALPTGFPIIRLFDFLKLGVSGLQILSYNSYIEVKTTVTTLIKAFDEDRTYRGLPLASDDENLRGLTHS